MIHQTEEDSKALWKSFKNDILKRPVYWLSILFITLLSYLFDLTNRTVGVDDLARTIYFGDSKECIAATRWGQPFWAYLLSGKEYTPFIDKYASIIFLIISAILFSRILYRYFRRSGHKLLLCTLFSCLYISYPLINEIWNYNGVNADQAGNAVLAAVSILLLYDQKKLFSKETLICSLLLSVVVSSYESTAFLYISLVLSIVLMDLILEDRRQWVRNGFRYAIPLAGALILRYAIGFFLIWINRLHYEANGATEIAWNLAESIPAQLSLLLEHTLNLYFARGLIYFPITMFDIAIMAGTISFAAAAVKQKKFSVIIIFLLLCGSLFLQSLVQGAFMPYRTAQTLQYFTAFSITVFLFCLSLTGKQKLLNLFLIFTAYLCYRQGVFMNRTLALNNQRSDNEAALAHNIGYQLKSQFEDKPVIFVGNLDLGNHINRQLNESMSTIGGRIYKKIAAYLGWPYHLNTVYGTNIIPIFIWNTGAYYSQDMMGKYFSYYGYDIQTWPSNDVYEYKMIAVEEGMKPFEIRDMGSYLLVFLG